MIEDTFEGLEDDGVEEEAQEEVEKILWELTSGMSTMFIVCLFSYFEVD